jgi:hypothetical protein
MVNKRYYLVAGTGNANENVIEAGLADVEHNAHFVILWTGKPTDGQARVLDWLIDRGSDFTLLHEGGKVHPVVKRAAGEVINVENLVTDAMDLHPQFEVLVLWDQDEQGNPTVMTEHIVLSATERGVPALDLCNGLVPLSVVEEASETPSVDTPIGTPIPTKTPLKTAPIASHDTPTAPSLFSLSYVGTDGKLRNYMGTYAEVVEFLGGWALAKGLI